MIISMAKAMNFFIMSSLDVMVAASCFAFSCFMVFIIDLAE